MSLINMAGWMWSPELVGWGRPGREPTKEMLGYYAGRLDGGRGRLSQDARVRQTINVWPVQGVYTLYKGDTLIYVGRGYLGERLLAHHRQDHLVGRWDAFSWISHYEIDDDNSPLELSAVPQVSANAEEFMRELEALLILMGNPLDNRQDPDFGEHTWWLEQTRSSYADLSQEEMMRAVYDKILNGAA